MRIVSIIVFVTLFIAGIVFINQKLGKETEPSQFLPSDTLVFAEQKNGLQALQQFRESRLGETLADIDFVRIFQDIDADPQLIELTRQVDHTIGQLQHNQLVQELLGKRISVALMPTRLWPEASGVLNDDLLRRLLIISRPRYSAKVLDMLASHFSGDIEVSMMPYGGHTIKRFQVDPDALSIAVVDGYVVGSFNERILRAALDSYDEPKGALVNNSDYHRFKKTFSQSNRILFLSLDGLRDLTKQIIDAMKIENKEAILKEIESTKGFTAAGYGAWRNADLVDERLVVITKEKEMSPFFRELLTIAPENNETLKAISAQSILYYWSNTLDPRLLYQMYQEETKEADQTDMVKFREMTQAMTGKSIEEILELIDGEISLLSQHGSKTRFIPVPDFAILLKIKDSEQVTALLDKVFSELKMPVHAEEYKGVTYKYWGPYRYESMQPVYGVFHNYLVVANTLEVLQTIIDTPNQQSALIEAKDFLEVDPGFGQKNNSVSYIDQATLMEVLRELVSWGGTILAIQDRQAAEKSKILIDQLINPLLHGFAMYEKTATRSYVKNDAIVVESRTKISR